MRRGGWRGTLVVILAMAMVAALAPASVAKKGGEKGPPAGLTVEALDATYEYPFYWVDSVGDTVRFHINVKGQAGGTLSWQTPTESGTQTVEFPYDMIYTVAAGDLWASDGTALPAFVARFTVGSESTDVGLNIHWLDDATGESNPSGDLTAVHLMKDCTEVGLTKDSETSYSGTVSEICIWENPSPGTWDVTLTNTGPRRARLFLSLRDHVPGNWCVTEAPDGTLGSLPEGRANPGGSIEGQVFIPQDGYCLGGGAGGDMMAVGTRGKYVLTSEAHVTLVTSP